MVVSKRCVHGPLKAYQHLIETKARQPNLQQLKGMMELDKLAESIKYYDPSPIMPKKTAKNPDMLLSPDFKWIDENESSILSKIRNFNFFKETAKPVIGPRGLYFYGGVGTGKSMLMDLFYNNVDCKRKRRVHFHEFMQSIHHRIHNFKLSKGNWQR